MTYLERTGTDRKRRLLKLVLLYAIIAVVVYGVIYFLFLAPRAAAPTGGGSPFPY